ncbi:MAG: LPXTG cell wall anchor domain-containing protein [Bifidobacteriaceae bacterium]|nr:LPXTG cell wall anchor domain-containing protein [Bifidobacteriaceae bacterium]
MATQQIGKPTFGRLARAVVVLVTAFLSIVVGVLGATPAHAVDRGQGVQHGMSWYGWVTISGKRVWCVTPGKDWPSSLSSKSTVTGGVDSDGTPDKHAKIAYLLGKYTGTADDGVSDKEAEAVSHLVREYASGGTGSHIDPSLGDTLWKEAEQNAGPWEPFIAYNPGDSKLWAAVARPDDVADLKTAWAGVKAAVPSDPQIPSEADWETAWDSVMVPAFDKVKSKAYASGVKGTLTLGSGLGLTFHDGGKATHSFTAAGGPVGVAVDLEGAVAGLTDVKAELSVSVWSNKYYKWANTSSVQVMVQAYSANTVKLKASTSLDAPEGGGWWQPQPHSDLAGTPEVERDTGQMLVSEATGEMVPVSYKTDVVWATLKTGKSKTAAADGKDADLQGWAADDDGKPVAVTAHGQLFKDTAPRPTSDTLPATSVLVPDSDTTVLLRGEGAYNSYSDRSGSVLARMPIPQAGSGWYTARWCVSRDDQDEDIAATLDEESVCDKYWQTAETFPVPIRLAVKTNVVSNRVVAGKPADDTLTVSLPDPRDQWMTSLDGKPVTVKAHGTLYGSSQPISEQPTVPAGAVKLGEATVNVALPTSGREPVTVPAPAGFGVKGSGYWVWVWEIRKVDQTAQTARLIEADVSDKYGSVSESGFTPMELAVSSRLPAQYRAKGVAPDDTITVSLPRGDDQWVAKADGKPAIVKVTGTYYAGSASSFIISNTPPADATALGTTSVKVTLPTSGRDPVTVPAPAGFTVPSSQYGTWVWQIDRADQTPDVAVLFDNDPADKFGQTLETHVTQMELTIHSEVADVSVPEPAGEATVEVCDTVWVEHTSPGDLWLDQWGAGKPVEVKVDGGLYRSAVPAAQTLSISVDVPKVADFSLTFAAAGKADAQTVCHTIRYGEYGAYGFAWNIDLATQPTTTKDYLSKGTSTPLWLPVETTMVRRTPVIHTAATSWTATNNGVEEVFLTDELWQTGWPDSPEDTGLYGAVWHGQWPGYGPWEPDGKTITVELWRIEGEVTPESCTAENPDARLIASNTATPAVNTWAAAQKVSGSRFKAEGGDATYTFVVTWPGDARTEPYRSVCGEKSETITLDRESPSFITELVTERKGASVETAQARTEAVEVEAGATLTDLLHAWFPGDARQIDMDGWTATWDAYWQPIDADHPEPRITADTSESLVYDGAACTPDTLYATSGDPVPVNGPGTVASGEFTMPNDAGLLYVVETVTDKQGRVVRRGACGVVSETAILKPPPPPAVVPEITTLAPAHAEVGQKITDEASLTGPYPEGTQVEFWYQHTPFINPGAARDELRCEAPDPNSMEGAIKIGQTVLDHAITEGVTEKLRSPEFTSDKEGCTWIKETAFAPGDGPEREILAEGHFGAVNERTMWHQPPVPPPPGNLPRTGADVGLWILLGGSLLAGGIGLVMVARRRRLITDGRASW